MAQVYKAKEKTQRKESEPQLRFRGNHQARVQDPIETCICAKPCCICAKPFSRIALQPKNLEDPVVSVPNPFQAGNVPNEVNQAQPAANFHLPLPENPPQNPPRANPEANDLTQRLENLRLDVENGTNGMERNWFGTLLHIDQQVFRTAWDMFVAFASNTISALIDLVSAFLKNCYQLSNQGIQNFVNTLGGELQAGVAVTCFIILIAILIKYPLSSVKTVVDYLGGIFHWIITHIPRLVL
jgi:hypothetical protein